MSLSNTPTSERIHIGFFGLRNSGKSSLVNKITNQDMSIVSDIKGTTTDSVKKSMELLPIGPVIIIDTPGIDDKGLLGNKRVENAEKILRNCDIGVLVSIAGIKLNDDELELVKSFKERNIPYVIVRNKIDLLDEEKIEEDKKVLNEFINNLVYVSTFNEEGIEDLKTLIGKKYIEYKDNNDLNEIHFVGDLIKKNDLVVLVTPIDKAAPKGRLILPQQLAIRDIIDFGGIVVVTKETELKETLNSLGKKPDLVITDSQVFKFVEEIIDKDIPLTSFSILMARYKGFLETAVKGVKSLEELREKKKANILISEGCTHHRQCDDIGTVKIPKILKKFLEFEPNLNFTSGNEFPKDIEKYDLIIHCGGCMLNQNEMKYRMEYAKSKNIPFTNYGICLAYMQGILDRTINML